MPVHELIMFTVSEAFAADPAGTLKPAAEFFAKTAGCLSVHGGVAEEEKTGYVVIAWETLAHHQALMDTEGYPGIIGLAPIFAEGGEKKVYHVELSESPDETLAMPTTEILSMSLKKNKTKEDVGGALALLTPRLNAEEGCSKTCAWGQTHEELRTVYLFLGWESTKRHFAVVGQRSYSDAILNLFSQVDMKMLHVSFKKVL